MWPKISIVTPALNAGNVLRKELESVKKQDYPAEKIEIIIADGGSTDDTLTIAKEFGAKVFENKLKTGEAGKVVGVKNATGEYIILLDSDNILPDKNWLKQMIAPLLKHPKAVGSEPWKYTWRKEDGFITRYCALIGMNDPLVCFLGNYDRYNLLTNAWTEVPHQEKDFGDYLLVTLTCKGVPTIGANGTVFRANYLEKNVSGDYLFDIDIIAKTIKKDKTVQFIKVKNGIVHTFCESSISKFALKQRRRVRDFLFHRDVEKDREFEWEGLPTMKKKLVKFVLYCVTVVPLLLQTAKGYIKKRDKAWFFHPLACEITLWEYGWGTIVGLFKKGEFSRAQWKQ